jgi:transposase InsO family protein
MPWKETCAVNERMRFVVAYEEEKDSMAVLCRRFGISRRTGYKWIGRFLEANVEGLQDRSRAPRSHPNQVGPEVQEAILDARAAHPTWGPKKLLALLERSAKEGAWPCRSTIADLLQREGLVVPRKVRRRAPPREQPFAACEEANAIWCADFKGWFRTGDGRRCDPLTISDAYSRYLLRCQVARKTGGRSVRPLFEAAFREYGLPRSMRTDNGAPFASRGVGGLSPLSVWWIKLGIVPERIDPGQPQQNGRHERMHLTLKNETAKPPGANARRQQELFDAFRKEFNQERPHEALEMRTPAEVYRPSPRPYPERMEEPRYDAGMEIRRIGDRGEFRWKVTKVFVGRVLRGESVGLEPLADRYWRVWFGPMPLGVFDDHRRRMLRRREWRATGLDASLFRSPFRCAPGAPEEP